MEQILDTIEIKPLSIKIVNVFDKYFSQYTSNYEGHYQVYVNDRRIVHLYFDLETALISGITNSCLKDKSNTVAITEGIRKMLDLPMRDLTETIKEQDGMVRTSDDIVNDVIQRFKLEIDE